MAIEIRSISYIQHKNPKDKGYESILPGDTVELTVCKQGKEVIHQAPCKTTNISKITCVIKQFDKVGVRIWDCVTGMDDLVDFDSIDSFRILMRGYRSYSMFNDGENPWDKLKEQEG